MEIKFIENKELKKKPEDTSNLGFGRIFTDYMFIMKYKEGIGWYDAEIKKYDDFRLSPASTILHYAQEVFEGLKAYKTPDGGVNIFRSRDNFARMNRSGQRMAMPYFDENFANEALLKLVEIEKDWIPDADGTSLYLRPNYFGTDPYVGVSAAKEYIFYIIASPVGAYYKNGLAPTRILIEKEYARSSKGGTGFAKTGGNYAASLIAGTEAHQKGCDQVLWLDANERRFVQEVGSMNIMFVIDDILVTPPLDGTILAGITRDSVLKIARSKGYKVEERIVSVDEIIDTAKSGAMTEAFGTGTAAVISPVGTFVYGDNEIVIAGGNMGEKSKDFYKTLTDIQYGRVPDNFGWITHLV